MPGRQLSLLTADLAEIEVEAEKEDIILLSSGESVKNKTNRTSTFLFVF